MKLYPILIIVNADPIVRVGCLLICFHIIVFKVDIMIAMTVIMTINVFILSLHVTMMATPISDRD
mgnify:FL=1